MISFISTSVLIWREDPSHRFAEANIAVIEIEGMITESMPIMEQIRELKKNENFKGVLVRIDSPGGAVGASQEIFYELKKLQEDYPVVASMGNLAASGGLYISLGAKRVFALPGTLTGSMGVITTITNFSRLLDKALIEPYVFKSGSLKDAGNPTTKMDPKASKFIQEMIELTFEQFRDDVKAERGLDDEKIKLLSDGRIINGVQAVEFGVAHEIGSFLAAVEYLKEELELKDDEIKLGFISRKPKGLVDKLVGGDLGAQVGDLFSSLRSGFYFGAPEFMGVLK